jgi:hypothetical protein
MKSILPWFSLVTALYLASCGRTTKDSTQNDDPGSEILQKIAREESSTIGRRAHETRGEERDKVMIELIRENPDENGQALVELVLKNGSSALARSLGRAFAALNDDTRWYPWVCQKIPAYLDAAQIGYVEGVALRGTKQVAEFIAQLPPDNSGHQRLVIGALHQLSKSPDFCLEDVTALKTQGFEIPLYNPVIREAVRKLIASVPDQDLEQFVKRDEFFNMDAGSLDVLAVIIAERDSSLALRWSKIFKEYGESAIRSVVGYLAEKDDDAALFAAIDAATDSLPRVELLSDAIGTKTERDPARAVEWLMQLSPEDAPAELHGRLMLEWYRLDEESAMDWALELPSGSGRDSAIEVLASSLISKDPEYSVSLALSLPAEKKNKIFEQMGEQMRQVEITGFIEQHGDSLGLSEEDRRFLLIPRGLDAW